MQRSLASALLLLSAGCTVGPEYPVDRPGTWRATGANDVNLQATIVNPNDLVRGQAAATDRGNAGARAVTRLFVERRRGLIRETSSQLQAGQQVQDAPLPGLDANSGAAQGSQSPQGGTAFGVPGAGLVAPAPPAPQASPAAQ